MTEIGFEAPVAVPRPRSRFDIFATADAKTLEILRHRNATRAPRRRGWLVRRALVVADLAGLATAIVAVELMYGTGSGAGNTVHPVLEAFLLLATLPAWIVVARLYRLYDQDEERTHHPTSDDLVRVFHLTTVCTWVFFAGVSLTGLAHPELTKVITLWFLAVGLIAVSRTCARAWCRRNISYIQNTVIVGAGDVGQSVARKLLRHAEYGINVVGFVDTAPKDLQDGLEHLTMLGSPEQLPEIVQLLDIERVVIAFSNDSAEELLELVRSLNELQVQIDIVPRLFELVGPNVKIDTVEGLPLVELPPPSLSRSSRWIKRSIDATVAGIALLLASPIFAYIALRVKLDSPGPIFFRQKRLGQDQEEFEVLKFRTMKVDNDDSAHREFIKELMDPTKAKAKNGIFKLDRGDAVTRSGRWLRATSLDELPQLINVLRGDMSLVGPRPCIDWETEHFEPHHYDRFLVPAGITGLWQVTARAQSTFKEALDMDVAYARGWSLGLDLRLLCRTPLQVLGRRATA